MFRQPDEIPQYLRARRRRTFPALKYRRFDRIERKPPDYSNSGEYTRYCLTGEKRLNRFWRRRHNQPERTGPSLSPTARNESARLSFGANTRCRPMVGTRLNRLFRRRQNLREPEGLRLVRTERLENCRLSYSANTKFHHEKRRAVSGSSAVNQTSDIRMFERGENLSFVEKAL